MNISESAINKLVELNTDNKMLRISVVGGGCSGLSYKMEFITREECKAGDKILKAAQLTAVVDAKSWLYLSAVEIDYDGGLNGQGFSYNNPAATRSCGCGTSFSV